MSVQDPSLPIKNIASNQNIRSGVFIGLALPLTLYLSSGLVVLGLDKFHYILAGGKKFATFPDFPNHLGLSLTYLVLVLIHLLWFLGTQPSYKCPHFSQALQQCAIFLGLAFLAYPLGNDVYLYLHFGLMNLSHVDPFTTDAGAFISGLSPFVDWKQTSTYGPISQLLFTIAAATIQFHPLIAVYAFKAICLAVHIFNGYLIWQTLPINQREKIAIAYLLCPVLLMEQVGSAHVDVFVCTGILLLAICFIKGHYARAFLPLWGGFLAKTLPVIWMPMLICFLIRKGRWLKLLLGLLASLSIAITLSQTILFTVDAWRSLFNPGVTGQYQSSIHALLRAWMETLKSFIPEAPSSSQQKYLLLALSRYTLIGFSLFYCWILWQLFCKPIYSASKFLEDIGWVTLTLMVFATSWVMPWYVSSLYAIAAILPNARLFGLTVLMFGVSSSAMYWLQGDSGLRSLVSVGIPALTLLFGSKLLAEKSSPTKSG
jgi:alpha-1,6-mannosyltransferase